MPNEMPPLEAATAMEAAAPIIEKSATDIAALHRDTLAAVTDLESAAQRLRDAEAPYHGASRNGPQQAVIDATAHLVTRAASLRQFLETFFDEHAQAASSQRQTLTNRAAMIREYHGAVK